MENSTENRPKGVYLPLITPLSRAIGKDTNIIFYLLVIVVTVVVLAVKTWGLVALTFTALAMVPLMFAVFIWVTLP